MLFLRILSPITGLIITVLTQVITFKYLPKTGLLKSIFLGFVFGLLACIAFEVLLFLSFPVIRASFLGIFFINTVIFISMGYNYYHFVSLGETGRRVRILSEIYMSKDGLSETEILERYNANVILKNRMIRLLNNGQVIFKDGSYYIGNPLMLIISKIISAFKYVLFRRGIT